MNRLELMSITEVSTAVDMTKDQIREAIDPLRPLGDLALTPGQRLGAELTPLLPVTFPLPVAIDTFLHVLYWRRKDIASYLDTIKVQRVVAGVDIEEAALREMRRERDPR